MEGTSVCCARCGAVWLEVQVEHWDGTYCPNCPDYKDDYNSLYNRGVDDCEPAD